MGSFSLAARKGAAVRQAWSAAPRLVQWFATERCPLSCPHCLAAGEGPPAPDLPLPEALDLVDQAADLGAGEFLVTGGEPLVREDLPDVWARLAAHGLPWSLNTALAPPPELRPALRRFPPAFAAVSLDGPAAVHDSFRGRPGTLAGALEAIRFFKSLPGCRVAAGTTVTAVNFPYLRETFALAAASGADYWGLHLPVPEGRAASRPDLFLSPGQLRALLEFAADRRRVFAVELADEFGYCGAWEPLVRSQPLTCGAGRFQCVVLPGGEVVPCTTRDIAAAAGNVRERALGEIWRRGFAELRRWRPTGDCAPCAYQAACRGGCWLLRRRGAPCAKAAWHSPRALQTAAGLLLCFGLAAQAGRAGEAPPAGAATPSPAANPAVATPAATPPATGLVPRYLSGDLADLTPASGAELEHWLLYRELGVYFARDQETPLPALNSAQAADPAWAYLAQPRPAGFAELCAAVRQAAETPSHSLLFLALLNRHLAEACLDGPPAAERGAPERQALRETLELLRGKAREWRREALTPAAVACLRRLEAGEQPRFFQTKAGPRPGHMVAWRWFGERAQELRLALDDLEDLRPWGEQIALTLRPRPAGSTSADCGVFDLLAAGGAAAPARIGPRAFPDRLKVNVELPAGAELSWADLVALADREQAVRFDEQVARVFGQAPSGGGRGEGEFSFARLPADPLLVPAVRRLAAGTNEPLALLARQWLADFWMF